MNCSTVSVVIPVYNAEKYLREALTSVLNQKYTNWECLIIDDGSTDGSNYIADEYCKKDLRLKYFYQNNYGPSSARNYGLRLAIGDYILFLDADDVILPNALSCMVKSRDMLEDNIILYSDLFLGDDTNIYNTSSFRKPVNLGRDIDFNEMYRKFGLNFLIHPTCVLFSKEVFDYVRWNEQLSHSEDWDLYLNILSKDFVFRFVPENLVIYRNSNNSLSKNFNKTFEANYSILFKWAKSNNYLIFSKRCALILKNSIMKYLLRKSKKIIIPSFKINSIKLFFYYLLIFPCTFNYLIIEFSQVFLKRVLKKSFEVQN